MRQQIPVVLRIEVFPAVAVVLGHRFVVLVVALRTLPVEDMDRLLVQLLVHLLNPLFYATQVHRNAAALAGPNRLLAVDLLRTHQTTHVVVTALALYELGGSELRIATARLASTVVRVSVLVSGLFVVALWLLVPAGMSFVFGHVSGFVLFLSVGLVASVSLVVRVVGFD